MDALITTSSTISSTSNIIVQYSTVIEYIILIVVLVMRCDVNEEDVSYRIAVTKETENNSRRPNSDSFSSELKYHAETTVLSYARWVAAIDVSNQFGVLCAVY